MMKIDQSWKSTLVCIPLVSESVDEMISDMVKAKEVGADLVEVRLDCLNTFTPLPHLQKMIMDSPLPIIFTYRPKWEGGHYDGDEDKRLDSLKLAIELGADYVDIELQAASKFFNLICGKKPEKCKVIVSSHDYKETPSPEVLSNLVGRIQATSADIVKIATTALDITDAIHMFQITVHSQVPVIGLVMGEKGLMSRVLCPKFGGYLTFGTLGTGATSAPGQPTANDLFNLYNFRSIGIDTKVFGIIGNPVSHSKSPLLYNEAFKSAGFNGVYLHLLVEDVKKFLCAYSSSDFAGFSCTIPHKETALRCCDEVDPIAERIGAVNCIVRRTEDVKLVGYNTDYVGAISAIEDGLKDLVNDSCASKSSPLKGKVFVVIGAGGAGKALAYGAKEKGARVFIANRTYDRARELADLVGGESLSINDLKDFKADDGMVLANTTSIGMYPHVHQSPIPKDSLGGYGLVFDAVYTPRKTRLLREAEEAGAIVVSGIEMFIRQAYGQYEMFTGLAAPKKLFREIMEREV